LPKILQMDTYLYPLIDSFRAQNEPIEAEKQSKYMKNKFPFIGIKAPARTELLKAHFATYGKPKYDTLNDYVRFLYELPEREFQYIALTFCDKLSKNLQKSDIELIEYLILTKSWWDTVDTVVRINKVYFTKFPEQIKPVTERWINSDNIWLKRSALIFQLNFKDKTDVELLFDYIERVKFEKEFFIQKAIGWALRQHSKTNPQVIEKFVHTANLSPLARREALKLLDE